METETFNPSKQMYIGNPETVKTKGHTETYTDKSGTYVAFSDGQTVEEYLKENPDMELLTDEKLDEYLTIYRKSMMTDWKEVTEERYMDMLEVMPPMRWRRASGLEFFFICEALTYDLHACFGQVKDRYFECTRSIRDKEDDIFKSLYKASL